MPNNRTEVENVTFRRSVGARRKVVVECLSCASCAVLWLLLCSPLSLAASAKQVLPSRFVSLGGRQAMQDGAGPLAILGGSSSDMAPARNSRTTAESRAGQSRAKRPVSDASRRYQHDLAARLGACVPMSFRWRAVSCCSAPSYPGCTTTSLTGMDSSPSRMATPVMPASSSLGARQTGNRKHAAVPGVCIEPSRPRYREDGGSCTNHLLFRSQHQSPKPCLLGSAYVSGSQEFAVSQEFRGVGKPRGLWMMLQGRSSTLSRAGGRAVSQNIGSI